MEFPDPIRSGRLGLPAQPLLVESVAAISPLADATGKLPDFSTAQKYLASVEAQLANGNFKVLVNGRELQMHLPEGARTGDQLNLLLLDKEPRLKFALLGVTTTAGESTNVTQRFLGNVKAQLPNGNFNVLINGQELQMRLPESIRPGDQLKLLLTNGEPRLRSTDAVSTGAEITQKFLVSVKAQLPNGNFSVLVNGQELQMHLPESTRPGSRMELVLVAAEPRLKSGDPVAAGATELSKTGRFLGALTQDAGRTLPAATANTAPLLSTPPLNPQQLPGLLQQAMSLSGLFYESHQAQWVTGKRTLEQLRQEPQGKLSATALTSSGSTSAAQSVNHAGADSTVTAMLRSADNPVHAQSLPLVQQQLNILETGQLMWRGEIWPGQSMEWDIAEHPSAETETGETTRWQTRLRLTLPNLGEVVATIGLDAGSVRVALAATNAKTSALMQSGRQPLAAAMEAAGLNIAGMEVRHDTG